MAELVALPADGIAEQVMCVRSEGARPQRVEVAGLAHRETGTWRRVSVGRRSWARSGTRRFRFRGYQRAFRERIRELLSRIGASLHGSGRALKRCRVGSAGDFEPIRRRRVAVHESMPGGPVDDRRRVRNR
ncbi:MAG: hypothetical protein BroJett003_04480 [Planctomycetota bacterium]|nr:MAG: hypothetical protein BroJett003_04480 [Planctomycetota bacterium]